MQDLCAELASAHACLAAMTPGCASAHIRKPNLASGLELATHVYQMRCSCPWASARHAYVECRTRHQPQQSTLRLLAVSDVHGILLLTLRHSL